MKNRKRVLISGAAGFLGSNLCDAFISKDFDIIAIDNLSTGSKKNIEHLLAHEHFTFIEHDICEKIPESISNQEIDVVANFASPASPPHYQRLAIETLHVGSLGVENMLMVAKKQGSRFIQASTSEVYGDPEIHPQPESYKGSVNSYGPRSNYDESKRFAESLIYEYRHKHKINTGIVRIFNTYGPRMDPLDGRVVSNFIVQALQNKPLTVYGSGNQTRSFCYVDDLLKGIVAMIESNQEGPINLGNPHEFTMLELANKILKLSGSTSIIKYEPLPVDDSTRRQPNIQKARTLLNWEPSIELDSGLKKTIDYFKNTLQIF